MLALIATTGCLAHERPETRDAGPPADAGTSTSAPLVHCGPARAFAVEDCAASCSTRFVWNGARCRALPCGECFGEDCDELAPTREACETTHAGCPATLCLATAGRWIRVRTGWEWCGWDCGVQRYGFDCGWPDFGCDCGPGRRFGPSGCRTEPTCSALPSAPDPELACTSTEGRWTPGLCCPTRCGAPCGTTCTDAACDCGPMRTFHRFVGCVDDGACLGEVGDPCCEARPCDGNVANVCADELECCGPAGCQPIACDGGPHCPP